MKLSHMRERWGIRPSVGHSLGGVLAMEVAAEAPDLPRSLVIVDSTPFLAGGFGAQPDTVETVVNTIREKMEGMSKEDFASMQALAIRTMVNSEEQADRLSDLANRSDQATVTQALSELIRTDLREGPGADHLSGGGGPGRHQYRFSFRRRPDENPGTVCGAWRSQNPFFEGARHFVMYDEPAKFRRGARGRAGGFVAGNALRENQTQGPLDFLRFAVLP